ncbi:hypothetical protein EUGRSUZ_B00170, partial [Eucalyptus grandis]
YDVPRHSLGKAFSEVVESNGDLHVLVLYVGIAVAEQHDLVVVSYVIVGDGNGGGAVDGVDEPVLAVGQGAVDDPDVAPAEDRHAVTVRYRPIPSDIVCLRIIKSCSPWPSLISTHCKSNTIRNLAT